MSAPSEFDDLHKRFNSPLHQAGGKISALQPEHVQKEKLGFKDAKTTLIAAGSMATVGAIVGLTGSEKKQPEDGVEEDQAPKKSSWFTPRRIIAGLLIVGASYLAFQAAKGNDPIGNFTRGLFGGGDKKEIRGR